MNASNPDSCRRSCHCDNRTITDPIASYVLDSVSDLRAMSVEPVAENEVAQTLGYWEPGDGGGNVFYWDPNAAMVDNSGPTIKPSEVSSGTGRWLALTPEVNVRQFGCKGDGSTLDTTAFTSAISHFSDAGGGECRVPIGTYLIGPSGLTGIGDNVHLTGEKGAIIKVSSMPVSNFLTANGDGWSMSGITVDMSNFYPGINVSAISATGSNWRITDCSIISQGRLGINVGAGDNWSIDNCYISKTSDSNAGVEAILVSGPSTNGRIVDNICVGSGIWVTNLTFSTISGNQCSYAKYGTNLGAGTVGNNALHITDNICHHGTGQDVSNVWVTGFEIWAPNSIIANNTSYGNDGGGVAIGGQNCLVSGNIVYDNGQGVSGRSGITARYLDATNNASGSSFVGNRAFDSRYPGGTQTQEYGYSEQAGLQYVHLSGNDFNHNSIGSVDYDASTTYSVRNTTQLQSAQVFDFVNVTTGNETFHNFAVAQAAVGDFVDVSFSASLQGCSLRGEVTSANTVKVILRNNTGGDINLGSGTVYMRLTKPADLDINY